jgi:hypothetical protein
VIAASAGLLKLLTPACCFVGARFTIAFASRRCATVMPAFTRGAANDARTPDPEPGVDPTSAAPPIIAPVAAFATSAFAENGQNAGSPIPSRDFPPSSPAVAVSTSNFSAPTPSRASPTTEICARALAIAPDCSISSLKLGIVLMLSIAPNSGIAPTPDIALDPLRPALAAPRIPALPSADPIIRAIVSRFAEPLAVTFTGSSSVQLRCSSRSCTD